MILLWNICKCRANYGSDESCIRFQNVKLIQNKLVGALLLQVPYCYRSYIDVKIYKKIYTFSKKFEGANGGLPVASLSRTLAGRILLLAYYFSPNTLSFWPYDTPHFEPVVVSIMALVDEAFVISDDFRRGFSWSLTFLSKTSCRLLIYFVWFCFSFHCEGGSYWYVCYINGELLSIPKKKPSCSYCIVAIKPSE